jgi:hypothetical protein
MLALVERRITHQVYLVRDDMGNRDVVSSSMLYHYAVLLSEQVALHRGKTDV